MKRSTLFVIAAAMGAAAIYGVIRSGILSRFKNRNEANVIPAEENVPHSMEEVEAASEDSFPASDPPAWTGTTGPALPKH
jgi:hypothetical protein